MKEDTGLYIKKNFPRNENDKINIYDYVVFPLCHKDENGLYKCVLHPSVTTADGKYKLPFGNIWFSSFIDHVVNYEWEEHKQYIINTLFTNHSAK